MEIPFRGSRRGRCVLGCGKIPPESREPCVCGNGLGNPPPGIPTGFCHEARGCAAEALPWVKAKDINNPNGVVPIVRMGGM